jgi:signal peptidase I
MFLLYSKNIKNVVVYSFLRGLFLLYNFRIIVEIRSAMELFSRKSKPTKEDDFAPAEERSSTISEVIQFSIIAVLIVVPIRMFVAQPFIVSGDSMFDTFESGQYIIIDQVSYYLNDPQRGEVIVFRYPRDPSKFFIKRIIGIPGDTITIEDTRVTITNEENPDGIELDEPYITGMEPGPFLEETLGDREYFVMGDNRNQSSDSRSWGVLQEERIIGRAYLRLFPPTTIGYLPGRVADPVTNS